MKAVAPEAKIIAILRNPVDRLLSAYVPCSTKPLNVVVHYPHRVTAAAVRPPCALPLVIRYNMMHRKLLLNTDRAGVDELPSLATVVERAIAHFKRCTRHAEVPDVTLFDGSIVEAPLFKTEDSFCFPQYNDDLLEDMSTMYPPFALKGLYYPQLVRYYEVYPKVRVLAWVVWPCMWCSLTHSLTHSLTQALRCSLPCLIPMCWSQSQILVLETSELKQQPQATMDRVCAFLHITPVNVSGNIQEQIGEVYVASMDSCYYCCCACCCCCSSYNYY